MANGNLRAEARPLFVPLSVCSTPQAPDKLNKACSLRLGFGSASDASDKGGSLTCKKRIDAFEFLVLHAKFNALILRCSKTHRCSNLNEKPFLCLD
jgi:hypothetical protein